MICIPVTLNSNCIIIDRIYKIAAGQQGACELKFRFTRDWDNLTKTVFVKYLDESPIEIILDVTDSCAMPDEAMAEPGRIMVGVKGTDSEGHVVFPTVYESAADVIQGVLPPGPVVSNRVPEGGSEGQALLKISNAEYDTSWGDILEEAPIDGTKYVRENAEWVTLPEDVIQNSEQVYDGYIRPGYEATDFSIKGNLDGISDELQALKIAIQNLGG